MSKISLKHSGGNVVSLNSPSNAPGAADVAFKLPNADGSDGNYLKTDGSGNLSFAALPAASDYVKLSSASGSSGGSAINIDNLDTATYRAFEIFLSMQPGTDNSNLYVRFRNGSNTITASNYVGWKEQQNPSNNVSHKSSGSQSLLEPAENIGADTEENLFIHVVLHVARSDDQGDLARNRNRIEYDTNYITHTPDHYSTRGVGHYSNDTTTYVNGIRFYFSSGNISDYMYTVYGIKR